MSNAEIADRLTTLARLLTARKENPWKIKAYLRAARNIRGFSESLDELARSDADLTSFTGIGEAIGGAVREIVLTGTLGKLEKLRAEVDPALIGISDYPRLDPKRVLRIYRKLSISSIAALKEKLESGEIEKTFGVRLAQHVRQGLTESPAMLLYRADDVRRAVEDFLLDKCKVRRVEAAGELRRRVEVLEELVFVTEAGDFPALVSKMQSYGGEAPLLDSAKDNALFALPSGVRLRIQNAEAATWGNALIACTGSTRHLKKLAKVTGPLKKRGQFTGAFADEATFYRHFNLWFIEPELREGLDEVEMAQRGELPVLVSEADIRGELHAHTTSSDGSHSIQQMADAAKKRGYEYIGITDHSQSLKIAGGVSVEDLRKQIRFIDRLNEKSNGIRILKSSEVDILADGSLDYPDDLLGELDYTVCSIHSRFGLGKTEQTERILRAMDNRHFNILGHATGRLLLKRPGYEIDMERVVEHAAQTGCFFEINSSPERLDLSADHARMARRAGIKIAVSTDAHSIREFGLVSYGIDQARRAGLDKCSLLNCLPLDRLQRALRR